MKDLVHIIRDNPGCIATIDNDSWTLGDRDRKLVLADSEDELESLGDGGYGSGNCYGGDILQALAQIVGILVVSV